VALACHPSFREGLGWTASAPSSNVSLVPSVENMAQGFQSLPLSLVYVFALLDLPLPTTFFDP
jgi:hypothetical protein